MAASFQVRHIKSKTSHRSLQKEFLSSIFAGNVQRHIPSSYPKTYLTCKIRRLLPAVITPRIFNTSDNNTG